MINMQESTILITCAKGIPSFLKQELSALGFPVLNESIAGIETEGTFEDTLRLNLYLRTAHRVLFVLKSIAVLALVLLAPAVNAELGFIAISATATAATTPIPKPSEAIMLCNFGANEVYYRVFDEIDTVAAATTGSAQLVAGSATAPVCISFAKTSTQPGRFAAVSLKCDTAETATVHLFYN